MDNLENQWRSARQMIETPYSSMDELITRAKNKKKSVLYSHFGNIIIFTITLVALLFFFSSINLRDSMSKAGMLLMVGGISVRLLIEIISTIKSRQIVLVNNASISTKKALSFFSFRKKIHGPASITTAVLYVIGFYLLSTEFSRYIATRWMIAMHVFFVFAAFILIAQAKKGMARENGALQVLVDIEKEINNY